jgi:hypothetical protein
MFSIDPVISAPPEPNIDSILDASHYLHYKDSRGNAIAITSSKALSALHNCCAVGELVTLIDSHGHSRIALVKFAKCEEMLVDIALLELQVDQRPFSSFVPIATAPVKLLQRLYVIGRVPSLTADETIPVTASCEVNSIHFRGTLFRSNYTGYDGLSGAGIVVVERINNQYRLAGVHVATHDDTESPPPIKKLKSSAADADSASASNDSLAKSIHGHTAYCLICEICRVSELIQLIVDDDSNRK